MSAQEYHQYARESLSAAARAKTEMERQTYLKLAQTYTQAALHEERYQGSCFDKQAVLRE